MTGRRRAAGVVALAVMFAVVGFAAVGAAQSATADSDRNLPDIAALQPSGESIQNAPTSVRVPDEYTSFAIRYRPVKPFAEQDWYYLGEQDLLRADKLTIRSTRFGTTDEQKYKVRLAYWTPERVQRGNRSVKIANVTGTETKTVTIGPLYDSTNVSLAHHFDDPTRVTMCIQKPGAENCLRNPNSSARWVFDHQSSPTDQGIPFSTTGGLWEWMGWNVIFPTLGLTGAVGFLVPLSIRRTGAGPRMGMGFWALVLGAGGLAVAAGAYFISSSLLITAPPTVAFLVAGIVGIIFLEKYESGVKDVVLFRLNTENSKGPNGEIAKTANGGEFREKKMVQMPGGEGVAVLPRGIRPWIARLCGGATLVNGLQDATSEIDLWNSSADKLLFVDSDAEDLIAQEPERLAFRPQIKSPPRWAEDVDDDVERTTDWGSILQMAVVSLVGGGLAYAIWQSTTLALLGGLAALVVSETEAIMGEAHISLAPAHAAKAYATALYVENELDMYESFEDALDAILREKKRSEDFLEYLGDLDDESIIQAAHERDTDEYDPFARDAGVDKEGSADPAGADD